MLDWLSIVKGTAPDNCKLNQCNPLYITLQDPCLTDNGHMFVLGAYVSGADPLGEFTIIVRTNSSYNHSLYDLYTRDGSKKDDTLHSYFI